MIKIRKSYLKLLDKELPEGLLVDGAWLQAKGIASNLRAYYVKAGWLVQPVRGIYRRPRGMLGWQQVVISLQTLLDKPLVVGGLTALELQGFAHYLSREVHTVRLYGLDNPPFWLTRLDLPQRFIYRNSGRLFWKKPLIHSSDHRTRLLQNRHRSDFKHFPDDGLTSMPWGQWDWSFTLSRPERAYLEMLDELPKRESFDQADKVMEGAVNFSPRRLQQLLVECRSVKVKRLFFFFADRHNHKWLGEINKKTINFGRGKRMLVRNGRYDPNYQITVPENIDVF